MDRMAESKRRSAFLAFMAVGANTYLIAFAADAILSLVEELFRAATGSEVLLGPRVLLATLVVLGSFLMFMIVLFVPHLPKLVLLPLIAFGLWVGFGAPPLFPSVDDAVILILLVVAQVILAVAAFVINKARTGQAFIVAPLLPRFSHLGLRTAFAVTILFVLFPIAIGSLAVAGTASYLERQTNGFVDFTTSDIRLTERIYKRNDKRIVLIGMMHLGESGFYDSLFREFPPDALVLAEGVTDKDNRLSSNLSYQRLARMLGLEQQPILLPTPELNNSKEEADTENPDEDDVNDESPVEFPDDIRTAKVRPDVIYADADLSDFSETTISFLNKTATLYDSRSVKDAIEHFSKLTRGFSDKDIEQVYKDIIYKRNDLLLVELDKNLATYDTIIIPWGAMHMPDLETGLLAREFAQTSERANSLIHYETILNNLREML